MSLGRRFYKGETWEEVAMCVGNALGSDGERRVVGILCGFQNEGRGREAVG